MVGVCLWVIIFVITSWLAKCEDCPAVCRCLGNFVDCSKKKFTTIPSNIPTWAFELDLNNNNIKKLNNVNWEHFSELKKLVLNKNNIVSIPKNVFKYQSNLKILELNRNKLKIIEALTFQSLNLSTLRLRRNQITELKDGAFYGLIKIDKLMLDYNYIKVVSKGWLHYGLETLKELYISHNSITNIDIDSWERCNYLQILDLSYNNLKSIEADTFKNLGQMQKMSLNNNNISVIKENAFIHLPKLKTLNLSGNKIWWAVEDAIGVFRGLNDLKKFFLADNKVKFINAHAFDGLKNVTYLNLENNNITSIQNNSFSKVPLLKHLIINTASLVCDCNLAWFLDWLSCNNFKLEAATCAYPDYLHGHLLSNVTGNLTCDELPKPRLIEEPDSDIMALKGGNVSLNCKAVSSFAGQMTFVWKKDNVELENPTIVEQSKTDPDGKSTETSSELNLLGINHTDAGRYQCVVSNSFGTSYSQKSLISVLVYPTFRKIPRNMTVKVGETIKLNCAGRGEPPPEIAWHKDGGNDFPAARERRMEVMPYDDVFFIVNAKPSDMGVYSCMAHNAAGTVVANATVTVLEKPSFMKSMEDKEFVAGSHVVLRCMPKGLPKPTISWYKDGDAIVPTERHFFIHEDQMVIIVDSVQADSGIYECRLNNSLGEERGHSRIIVKSNSYDLMGIIIITVVCCAVITSIIWVVIIYQTRRRIPPAVIQTEMQTFPSTADQTIVHQMQLRLCPDNVSDQSSCKDSGTGDSAKRSSDDLVPEEFTMVAEAGQAGTEVNNSHVPLLNYPRSTNHDRLESGAQSQAQDV